MLLWRFYTQPQVKLFIHELDTYLSNKSAKLPALRYYYNRIIHNFVTTLQNNNVRFLTNEALQCS